MAGALSDAGSAAGLGQRSVVDHTLTVVQRKDPVPSMGGASSCGAPVSGVGALAVIGALLAASAALSASLAHDVLLRCGWMQPLLSQMICV